MATTDATMVSTRSVQTSSRHQRLVPARDVTEDLTTLINVYAIHPTHAMIMVCSVCKLHVAAVVEHTDEQCGMNLTHE